MEFYTAITQKTDWYLIFIVIIFFLIIATPTKNFSL